MWNPQFAEGYEARKCRYRVLSYCRGLGLDLSCKNEKIVESAIGVGPPHWRPVDIPVDLTANDALRVFSSDYFDYVFDAHQLGNYVCTEAALKEWWRVIRYGGHLILYEQDPDFYPRIGTPGAADARRKDISWKQAWKIIKGFGNAKLVSASKHGDSNEYSWQLVVQKKASILKKPFEILVPRKSEGRLSFPRQKKTNKEALVIRYGALGDSLWLTPVLSQLKKDGYYVVVNCDEYSAQVLKEDPNVDEFIVQEKATAIEYEQLDTYWEFISQGFEKVLNLTKSVEGALLKCEGSDEFNWPHEKRHVECNVNFQDRTMEMAGYPEIKGALPTMHFSELEESLAQDFLASHQDKFTILWGLAGSAYHKVYPWSEYVANELAMKHPKNVEIITVGDGACKILEWQNPITTNKSGVWTVRQSFLMAKYADLVISADSGLANAASCWETPQIVFLSTNSIENLCKYWKNCTALWAEDCECYPCHRLIYTKSACPKGTIAGVAPKCMENIKPERVLQEISRRYNEWEFNRAVERNKLRFAAMTIADSPITYRLAKRAQRSFEKFHPDIPFYTFDPRNEKQILGEEKVSACASPSFAIRPRLCEYLLRDYDGVIYLDADTVTCGRLTEFLDANYDVAGSLNIGSDEFLNAGVSAITSSQFCREWTDRMYQPDSGPSNQVYFNELAHSSRYRLKTVDKKDVYYNEQSRKYWKDLKVTPDGLECNGRKVRVLHWAGGSGRMEDKLSSSDFSAEVREFLDDVTGTKDFTEEKGVAVSQWT